MSSILQKKNKIYKFRSQKHHHHQLFSAIKETEQLFIIKQQRKATRGAIRLNELVAYAIAKSYKPIMNTYRPIYI